MGSTQNQTTTLSITPFPLQKECLQYQNEHGGCVFAKDKINTKGVAAKEYYHSPDLKTFFDFLVSMDASDRNFYELLVDRQPVRAYIDFDGYVENNEDTKPAIERLEKMQQKIIDTFKNKVAEDFGIDNCTHVVLASDGETAKGYKVSRHIYFDGVFFKTTESAKNFFQSNFADYDGIDLKVYTKNRLMRMLYNSKKGSSRTLLPENGDETFNFELWKKTVISKANNTADYKELVVVANDHSPVPAPNKRLKVSNKHVAECELPPCMIPIKEYVTSSEFLRRIEGDNLPYLHDVRKDEGAQKYCFNFRRGHNVSLCYAQQCLEDTHVHQNNKTFSIIYFLPTKDRVEGRLVYRCLSERCGNHSLGPIPKDVLSLYFDLLSIECDEGGKSIECDEDGKPVTKLQCTQSALADLFVELYGDRFIAEPLNKGFKVYYYTGVFWMQDIGCCEMGVMILDDFVDHIKAKYGDSNPKMVSKAIAKIQNRAFKTALCGEIGLRVRNLNPGFDEDPKYFAFNNKVYDLEKHDFVDPHPDQRISLTTGYDWREPTEKESEMYHDLINSIFRLPDERNFYKKILGQALYGETLEKFVVANGSGRNGKGVINELAEFVFGSYAYVIPSSVLQADDKSGVNVEKNKLHNIRLVFAREPSHKRKINFESVKELTGGSKINARTMYSEKTDVHIKMTLIMECNDLPPINITYAKEADIQRIVDIPFRSTFTEDESRWNADEGIFPLNPFYKSKKFKDSVKYAAFRDWANSWKDYDQTYKCNFYKITPQCIRDRAYDLLNDNDDIARWFFETYEETKKEDDVLKFSDVWCSFSLSHVYENMTSRDKRIYSRKKVLEHLKKNIKLKGKFIDKMQNKAVVEKYNCTLIRNAIVGYKYKQ